MISANDPDSCNINFCFIEFLLGNLQTNEESDPEDHVVVLLCVRGGGSIASLLAK